MKRILLILAMAGALFSQSGLVTPTTPARITGDGSAHQVATSGTARWIIFVAVKHDDGSANSADVVIGDSTVSATRGTPLSTGAGLMYPAMPPDARQSTQNVVYDLSKIYYFAATGDRLSIIYVK